MASHSSHPQGVHVEMWHVKFGFYGEFDTIY